MSCIYELDIKDEHLKAAINEVVDGSLSIDGKVKLYHHINQDSFLESDENKDKKGNNFFIKNEDGSIRVNEAKTKEELVERLTDVRNALIKSVRENQAKVHRESLMGFKSSAIKNEAIDHTADVIIKVFEEATAENASTTTKDIAVRTADYIRSYYRSSFLEEIEKEGFEKVKEEYNTLNDKFLKVGAISDRLKAVTKEIVSKKTISEDSKKELESIVNDFNNEVEEENKIKVDVANITLDNIKTIKQKIIKEHNNRNKKVLNYTIDVVNNKEYPFSNVLINYAKLVDNVAYNLEDWFSTVFNNAKVSEYSSMFDDVLSTGKLNRYGSLISSDEIEVGEDRDSTDEFSKHWSDSLPSDFSSNVTDKLIKRLSRLYQLSEAVVNGSKPIYDKTPHLGVPHTMNVKRVMAAIYNYGNFNSPIELINSLEKLSKIQPEMYGLSSLVDEMKNDPILTNEIFHSFANPKIKKAMVEATKQGIEIVQSNKTIDTVAANIYTYLNDVRSNYLDVYNEKAHNDVIDKLSRYSSFRDSASRAIAEKAIREFLSAYIPSISERDLHNYLEGYHLTKKEREGKTPEAIYEITYRNAINFVITLNDAVSKTIGYYNELFNRFTESRGKYNAALEGIYSSLANYPDELNKALKELGEAPTLDISSINFSSIESAIISIATELAKVTIVNNELNTFNAEGNMASDVIANSNITNLIKQIKYGTEEDANVGLNRLKDFITQSDQYKYSPIFFGVTDERGRVIKPGLFVRTADGVEVHPKAKELIDIFLFDGVKDRVNGNNSMYDKLSRQDYFLTQLITYRQAIPNYSDDKNVVRGGYFLRTPSDASKNFILKTTSFVTGSLYSIDGKVIDDAVNTYFEETIDKLYVKEPDSNENPSKDDIDVKIEDYDVVKAIRASHNKKGVEINNPAYFNSIINGEVKSIKVYNARDAISLQKEEDNDIYIVPVKYAVKDSNNKKKVYVTAYVKVSKKHNEHTADYNVEEVVAIKGEKEDIDVYKNDIKHYIADEFFVNGKFADDVAVNTESVAYRAYKQQLIGELNNLIENLNNVFEFVDGKLVSKKSTDGLIERYHFNGSSIVKNGRLTGAVFSFNRLFDLENFDINEAINQALSLYGQADSLFVENKDGSITLNTERKDALVVVDSNGKIKLNLNEDNRAALDNVVNSWMKEYINEIIRETAEYRDLYKEAGFTADDAISFVTDATLQLMNLDDLFEGDSKFYKNALDLLKRSKEVQAGGKAYGNMDVNDVIGGELVNRKDYQGKNIEVVVGKGKEFEQKIPIRNGFRAVTIKGTSKSSDSANNIFNEVYSYLIKTMSKENAERIAEGIAKGYRDATKINDAQSFITLEEFIARKHADGTYNEYKELIEQLYDPSVPIEEIDVDKLNAKIQSQKNFYFDKQFDTATGTYYARQIKNSEYVLIPKIIKGTSLETLYNIMRAHDIGQVNTRETSKAANKNVLEFWDRNTGEVKAEPFEEKVKQKIGVENYYYRYLYKQQDVVDHLVDAENKAGVQFMKKVIDNVEPHLTKYVEQFHKNYVANIKDSFDLLLNRLGWKIDKNGKLVQRKDKDDNRVNINNEEEEEIKFDDFYRKARAEARRLGLDSNFIDYLTQDELGDPRMPNYMNNVSTKLESIAQSMFNSAVTRQKLPGWHAVQITPLGVSEVVKDENGNYRKLQYHPEVKDADGNVIQEAYAEVLVPRWSNLIPKNYDISKLEKEGLDIHVGYRIPTEGKQSISIIKIVGFLDDVEGSKVVVPEEWVTQTGSDFDVDTMYVVSPEIVKDSKGDLHKVQFDSSTEENDVRRRYVIYVNDRIKELVKGDEIRTSISQLKAYTSSGKIDKAREENKELFDSLREEQTSAFMELTDEEKITAKKIYAKYKSKTDYALRHAKAAEHFRKLAAKPENLARREVYEAFADVNEKLVDAHNSITAVFDKIHDLRDKISEARDRYFKNIEDIAKSHDLLTYEEFSKLSIESQNTVKARNNQIIDAVIAILNDPSTREENYSRSNFDDIVEAMSESNIVRTGDPKGNRIKPSAYNPLHQIKFMENAMGGATLKAFSVTRDNFVSVSNKAKTVIHGMTVNVVYDLNNEDYDKDIILSAYPKAVYNKKNNTITVTHNRLGWSENNRNVTGKLLTPYSSQTTAHILDAVKEGSIFNENRFTFGSFKTLVDIGIDYKTAVAFLMQPVITRISDYNNKRSSVYNSENNRPVYSVIKDIAAEYGIKVKNKPVNKYTNITDVFDALTEDREIKIALQNLGVGKLEPSGIKDILLDKNALLRRLSPEKSSEMTTAEKVAFDLVTALQFQKLHTITTHIERVARVTNPDKFGAKQSIRATRQKLDEIKELNLDEIDSIQTDDSGTAIYLSSDAAGVDEKNKPKGFVNAIYPIHFHESNGERDDYNFTILDEKSVYPPLAAFIKYTTLPSVQANSKLFTIKSKQMADYFDSVAISMGAYVNEERYKELENEYVSYVYHNSELLSSPISIDEYGRVIYDEERVGDKFEEVKRIKGINVGNNHTRRIEDVNKPTAEDIAWFNKLSPAQKAMWIKINFQDDAGIFKFLNVSLYNPNEVKRIGYSRQTITFNDQNVDIEEIYNAFRESYYNTNDFVRLAAIDLVKYAFIAEGFKFKKGSISKIITNDVLINDTANFGLGLIDEFNRDIKDSADDDFKSLFVRSHTDWIRSMKIKRKTGKDVQHSLFEERWIKEYAAKVKDGVIIDREDVIRSLFNLEGASPIPYGKRYINIVDNGESTTYTIEVYDKFAGKNKPPYKKAFMYPINKLEVGEFSEFSSKKANNKFLAEDYYESGFEAILKNNEIDTFIGEGFTNEGELEELKTEVAELEDYTRNKDDFKFEDNTEKPVHESVTNQSYFEDVISSNNNNSKPISVFVNDILEANKIAEQQGKNTSVVMNNTVQVKVAVPQNATITQKINDDGVIKTFTIRKKSISRNIRTVIKEEFNAKSEHRHINERIAQIKDRMSDTAKFIINQTVSRGLIYSTFYDIKRVDESTTDPNAEDLNVDYESESTNLVRNSSTRLIEESPSTGKQLNLENLAKGLATDITREAIIKKEKIAKDFISDDRIANVDFNNAESVANNIENVLEAEAEYMIRESKRINAMLDKFILEGEFNKMDVMYEAIETRPDNDSDITDYIFYLPANDPRLYEYFKTNPEEFNRFAELMLHARKLVSAQEGILSYDVRDESNSVKNSIATIRRAVTSLRNNNRLNNAFNMMFNNYIASMYSTNPVVKQGIVDLRTHFGDINWFDFNLSDIHELNHKQIQAVIKAVNQIIDHARMHVIPKAVRSFNEEWEAIEKKYGKIDLNHIIDDKGKIVQEYTREFIEDRKKLRDAVYQAKEDYSVDSVEYHRAKLEYDEWKAFYTNQEIEKEYYVRETAIRRSLLDTIPETYVEYMRLTKELYSGNQNEKTMTPEEKENRRKLRRMIDAIINPTIDDDYNNVTPEEERRYNEGKFLKDKIKLLQKVKNDYFTYIESDGFKETLDEYLTIIENYDKRHPYEELSKKLENEAYREAYEWLEHNTTKSQDGVSRGKITDAFMTLNKEHKKDNASLTKLAIERDAYNPHDGNIDGRKFTEEDIDKLREKAINDNMTSLGNGTFSDDALIKNTPLSNEVYKNDFYILLKGNRNENAKEWEKNPERIETIRKINNLLIKFMDYNAVGENPISAKVIYEKLINGEISTTDIEELIKQYAILDDIESERPKNENGENLKGVIEIKENRPAFDKEMAFISGIDNEALKKLFIDLFTEGKINKKRYKANRFMFSYVTGNKKYLDEAKTKAKTLIVNATQQVTTRYYTLAKEKAIAEGRYEEWYERNHLYNNVTHRVEPLRIWTTLELKDYEDISGTYHYHPTFENRQKTVYQNKLNKKYDKVGYNYDSESAELARREGKKSYDANRNLTEGEIAMANLIRNTLSMYAGTYSAKKFISEAYMPRRAKVDLDTRWWTQQALGSVGLALRDTSQDTWNYDLDYEHDTEIKSDMMTLLKDKHSKEFIKPLDRVKFASNAEYAEHLKEVEKENAKIKKENEEIDAYLISRNWKSVMEDFIKEAIDVNSRNKSKNLIYLLIEDLKNNGYYKQSNFKNKLIRDKKHSTQDTTEYVRAEQSRAIEMVTTWANRVIFGNFKQKHPYTKYADMAQNMTSAKYMMLNVTGAIANIGTGMANIMGEAFAGEYFDVKDILVASAQYSSSILHIVGSMFSEKGTDKISALIKYFDIVDYTSILEKAADKGVVEVVEEIRNLMYGLQTGGEHMMQNLALLSGLRSHRVYTNEDGRVVTGTIDNYTADLRTDVLKGIIAGNEAVKEKFDRFYKEIIHDKEIVRQYDRFDKDIVDEFLKRVDDDSVVDEFRKLEKEAMKMAKSEFEKLPKLIDELEFDKNTKDIVIRDGSVLTEEAIEFFKSKMFRINNRIHGVYNKIGAANIEKYWWGSLVMQYHKHLYPGFMKRFRQKGFYNETRQTREKASYIAAFNLLFGEYGKVVDETKRAMTEDEHIVMASLKAIGNATLRTFIDARYRYDSMPSWQKRNVRRVLGDLAGMAGSFLMAVAIYGAFDDDDIKDSDTLNTIVYSSDRMFAESYMWNPIGLANEAKTLWSSPIAATNTPIDIYKALILGVEYLSTDEFDLNYSTGLYKGQNKIGVLLSRNIPIYRVYKRLSNMSKNNQYYRINDNSLNMKSAKTFANLIKNND